MAEIHERYVTESLRQVRAAEAGAADAIAKAVENGAGFTAIQAAATEVGFGYYGFKVLMERGGRP